MLKENQLNAAVEQVSNELFSKVKYQAFLNGTQIANFCSYEQINRFLLFQIYIDWKSQVQKLKHPYFDFQHPEVKEALEEFLNVLSNHIHVEQKDFKLLLEKAVYNAVKLLNEPLNSFLNFFFATKSEVSVQLISQYVPYFHDFDFILQSILLYCENHRLEKLSKDKFQELYQKAIVNYERFSGDSIEQYRSVKLKELMGHAIVDIENKVIQQENKQEQGSIVEKSFVQKKVIQQEKPTIQEVSHVPKQPAVSIKKEVKIKKIPLNKQFQYSQKLFKGDLEALKKLCEQIAEVQDIETAKNLIQKQVLDAYQIDPEDALFQEFANLALSHIL